MAVSDMLADVLRFQSEVIGLTIPTTPTMLEGKGLEARQTFIKEEWKEFTDAKTVTDQADALLDLAYVALGGLVQMGVTPGPVWDEVQRTNMLRQAGKKASRPDVPVGMDAVKPEGWEPPDLRPYLTATKDELVQLFNLRNSGKVEAPVFPDKPLIPTQPAVFSAPAEQAPSDEAAMVAKKRKKYLLHFIPYAALQMAARVFAFGATKYSTDGYKRNDYKFTELTGALARHVKEFEDGKDFDVNEKGEADKDHSGEPLIGHMLCCAMMLAWRWVYRRKESDDRTKTELQYTAEWK